VGVDLSWCERGVSYVGGQYLSRGPGDVEETLFPGHVT
jgi:hypothetical protein